LFFTVVPVNCQYTDNLHLIIIIIIIVIIIIIIDIDQDMGTGVGQVGTLAYYGNMDTPAHQSLG